MSDDGSTMTDLLRRTEPSSPRTDVRASPPPAWLVGAAAGLAAAVVGVLACLGLATLAWLFGDGGSMSGALRTGAGAWLLAHGSGLRVAGGTVSVVPLGLTMGAVAVVWFAGRWCAGVCGAAARRDAAMVGGAVGLGYAAVAGVVSLMTAGPPASPSVLRATAIGLLLAGTTATCGAAWVCGAHRPLLEWLPVDVIPVLRGAGAGLAALVGCGALVLTASLVVHVAALQRLLESLHLGAISGLLLVLVCILVLPNVVLFAVAVLVGPGFVLGTGTSVTATSVELGAVPAVPWLAALPGPGDQPLGITALAALPLLCGVLAGAVAVRARPVAGYRWACARGGLAGAVGGCGVGALLAVSGGSIGPGRMADVGPAVLACLVVAVLALGAGGVLGGAGARFAVRD